ncbi:hypothetical protein EG329_013951 [Mollisiaceae sp. DMI_Dod_QoI]|nr:hypothetical protein EG329_013951 [Helotiales sp. DMI_Dod_QoI]
MAQRLPACPICWHDKHPCLRDPITSQCRDCKTNTRKSLAEDDTLLNKDPFSEAVVQTVHTELQNQVRVAYNPSCHIRNLEQNILGLQFQTSAGKISKHYSHEINGPFNLQYTNLVKWLDEIVGTHFKINLHGVGPCKEKVDKGILVGGYINLLCSCSQIVEVVQTTRDDIVIFNEMGNYNLHIQFQDLVLSRLRELMHEIFTTTIFKVGDQQSPEEARATYVAMCVLYWEVDYFRDDLRRGPLSRLGQVPLSWKGPDGALVKWFTFVGAETKQWLQQRCGHQVDWQEAVSEKRRARRKLDTHQTFKLKLTLHQIEKKVLIEPTEISPYRPLGDGDVCLTSPPGSPLLTASGQSNDIHVTEDKIPCHVSYLALLEHSSTGAETSDIDLDLLDSTFIR